MPSPWVQRAQRNELPAKDLTTYADSRELFDRELDELRETYRQPLFDSEGMTNCHHGTYLPDGDCVQCGRELDADLDAMAEAEAHFGPVALHGDV
jgi:hypothetical protein